MTDPINNFLKDIVNEYALSNYMTLDILKSILQEMDIQEEVSKVKKIGRGMHAVVLWLPNRKQVLKITNDRTDAEISVNLIGKKLKHLVHVYDVFQVDKVYCIQEEKLTPLSSTERKRWNSGLKSLRNIKLSVMESAWRVLQKYGLSLGWVNMLREEIEDEPYTNDIQHIRDILSALEGIASDLEDLGVFNYQDIHDQNVMMRGQTLVLVDFGGGTKVQGAPSIRKIQ